MNKPRHQETPPLPSARERIDEVAQEWFILLSSGKATGADRRRFHEWSLADPRHLAAYEELMELWGGIDGLRDAFAEQDETRRAEQHRRVPAPVHGQTGTRFRRRHVAWSALAAACIAVVVFAAPEIGALLRADSRTGVGEQARVEFPDGSMAWLNTDTAVDVQYEEGQRRIVLLHGEAEFHVAKDPARPFTVLALQGQITALGTTFAVRDHGRSATVTVRQGKVEVASPDTDGTTSRAVLGSSEQVSYPEGQGLGPVRTVDTAAALVWRKGFINVRGMPFADALAEIDRYRPGRIVLLADTAKQGLVTARLSIRAIDEGLDALAATQGLSVTRVTKYLTLIR